MSQSCPVCKTRLWTDVMLTPGRLRCPRCGAEFRPTVPWVYFRFLLFVVVTLALVVLSDLDRNSLWIGAFLLFAGVGLWFIPKFIDLQRISGDLTVPEGPMDTDPLADREWNDEQEALEERSRFWQWVSTLVALVFLLLLLLTLTQRS